MDTLATRLKDQNNGTLWTDCNSRFRPHSWAVQQEIDGVAYHQCRRCPVITRNPAGATPAPYLPALGGRSKP